MEGVREPGEVHGPFHCIRSQFQQVFVALLSLFCP